MPITSLLKGTGKKKSKAVTPPIPLGPPKKQEEDFDPLNLSQKAQLNLTGSSTSAGGRRKSSAGGGAVLSNKPPAGGGGGGRRSNPPPTGSGTQGNKDWSVGYELTEAPAWWRGLVPPNANNPNDQYLATLNSLIPYMSPEDQRRVATSLARTNDAFSIYSAELIGTDFPTEITSEEVDQFTSAERGASILSTLDTFAQAAGIGDDKQSKGFAYLQDFAKLLRDFGGTDESGQTRTQASQLRGLLDPMLSEANTNELSAYGEVARTLAFPFFSAGELQPVTRSEDGTFIFGRPNPKLFG